MSQANNPPSPGIVTISEDVVSILAGVAAGEVKGVFGMCNTIAGGISEILGRKNLSKGVKVELSVPDVKISLSLVVEYGCKIPDVAWEVQEQVKREIETMTSLNVTAVDVFVNGIHIPREADAEQAEA